jgi:hypothetical protein
VHLLIVILTALLLIPAAVAGILGSASLLIANWGHLSGQLHELARAAEPLWPLGQSLLGVLAGLSLLGLAGGVLVHELKSRV